MFSWKKRKEGSSFFAAWASKGKRLLPLVGGLTLTAAGIFLARERILSLEHDIRAKTAPVQIVVAAVPIAAGEALSERNLAKGSFPASAVTRRNVLATDAGLLLGAKAQGPIGPGEPVLRSDVAEGSGERRFSQTIPEGRRAVTVEADRGASFSGLVRTGDRVDIYCRGSGDGRPSVWLRDIAIAAVDRQFGASPDPQDPGEPATITLAVTPDEERRLASFLGSDMKWFLRNPDDRPRRPTGPGSGTRSWAVEIWKGGIRESGTQVAASDRRPWE